MTSSRPAMLVVCCAVLGFACLLRPDVATAQVEKPQRIYRGLFGSPAPDPDRQQTLDFTASLFGGYDENLTIDQGFGTSPDPRNQIAGTYGGLGVGLTYGRHTRAFDFDASGGSNANYYPNLGGLTLVSHQGALGATVHGRRMTLRGSVTGDYKPYFSFLPFIPAVPIEPGTIAPQTANAPITRQSVYSIGGDVRLEQQVGRSSSVSINGSLQTTRFTEQMYELTSDTIGGRFRHQVSPGAGVHIGYEYQTGNYSMVRRRLIAHNIDAGMDYAKALGRTRRTTVTFNVGSTIIEYDNARLYRVIGDASLNREIGRSWVGGAAYHRGVGFVQGFEQPFFSDAFSASLAGNLTRRWDARLSGSYNTGEIGVTGPTSGIRTYAASSRIRFALNPILALYAEYFAYRYEFDSAVYLPVGFPSRMDRQGVRGGVSLWVPLVR